MGFLRQAALAAAALVLSCAGAMTTGAMAQDIKIGFGGIFSGPYSTYSEDARKAMEIYLADVNAAGGVNGHKLVVDYYDTAADRAKAIAAYRKYAADPAYAAYFTISTIEFVALDPIANEVKLPMLPFGSSGGYKNFSDWSFRTGIINTKAEPNVLAKVKQLKGVKSIYVLFDSSNTSMVSAKDAVTGAVGSLGIALKGVDAFATNDQDFSAQLTKVADANPDLLYVGGSTYEASLIITQARAMGIKAIPIGGAGLNDPRIAKLPNNASEGMLTYYAFDPNEARPMVQKFVAEYKARYKDTPPAYAALGYDALAVVADAVRRAGGTDRDAVRRALGSTTKLEVLSGTISFNGSGDNLDQNPHVFENHNGSFVRID